MKILPGCSCRVVFGVVFLASAVQGQEWTGLGTDDNWSTMENWSVVPANDGSAVLSFGGATRPTPSVDAVWSIDSLVLNPGGAFALGGSGLTIGAGGISKAGAETFSIGNEVTLGAAQVWGQSADGALAVNGAVHLGAFGLTLDSASTSVAFGMTLSGAIDGVGGLTKTGAGYLVLGGSNGYSGGTQLNEGTIVITSDANLGDTGAGLLFDGGALRMDAAVTLGAGRTVGINPGGGTIDTNGFAGGVAGAIMGPGKLTKSGAGTLTIGGSSTYQGGTHVEAGDVIFDGTVDAGAGVNLKLELANGTSVTFNDSVSGGRLLKSDVTTGPSQANVTFTAVGTFNTAVAGSSFAQGDLILTGANGALQFTGVAKQLDLLGLPGSTARLILDNSITGNADRVTDATALLMFGNSALKFVGNADAGVQETMGVAVLASGVTAFEIDAPSDTANNVANGMTFGSWAVNNARAADNYLSVTDTSGGLGQGGENPFVKFNTGLANNELIARANYAGTDLLEYSTTDGLRAATSTNTLSGAGASDDVRLDVSETVAGSQTIRSLAVNGVTVDGAGSLAVQSGMILTADGSVLDVAINATNASNKSYLDTRGDTMLGATFTSAATLEKWGEGVLTIGDGSGGSVIIAGGSGTFNIQQGGVKFGGSGVVSSTTQYSINNGATLDLQGFNATAALVVLDEGSAINGSGTLTTKSLLTSTSTFGAVGVDAVVNANLIISGDSSASDLYVADSTALVLNGATTLNGFGSPDIYVGDNSSLVMNGAVATATNRVLVIRSLGDVAVNGTVATNGIRLSVEGTGETVFNNVATFTSSAQITDVLGQIQQGTVRLAGADGAFSGLHRLHVGNAPDPSVSYRRPTTDLVLDNSSSANSNRISDSTVVELDGQAGLTITGNAGADVTEVIGTLAAGAGETRVSVQNAAAATASTTLQVNSLTRDAGNILMVSSGGGTLGAGANSPNILVAGAGAGFMERTIVNGTTFAKYDTTNGIQAANDASVIAGATAATHVVTTANETVNTDTTIGSLVATGTTIGGTGKLTSDTGHFLLKETNVISNDIETAGDAFVYATGSSTLSGSLAVGGDFRKAGGGDLTVGSLGKSLEVGAGKAVYVDAGTLSTTAASAIADGTDVTVRQAVLNVGDYLNLGDVVLQNRADIVGAGDLVATSLTIDESSAFVGQTSPLPGGGITAAYADDYASVVAVSYSGVGDMEVKKGAALSLQAEAAHEGATVIDGRTYVNGAGAISGTPLIEVGKNSNSGTLFVQGGVVAGPVADRIGNATDVDLYGNSQFRTLNGTTGEVIGDLTIRTGASALYGGFTAKSLTSYDAWSQVLSGTYVTDSVSVWKEGVETVVSGGQVVPTLLGYNGGQMRPVAWVGGGLLQALEPIYLPSVNSGSGGNPFVSFNSAQSLTSDQTFDFVEFLSVDPFTSTPGSTLLVQTGLFFNAESVSVQKEMDVDVRLTSDNASISSNGIVRFNQALTADGDLTLSGSASGVYVIDGTGNIGGDLTLANGKLVVGQDSASATLTGNVVVQNGASLGGSGTIEGDVEVEAGGATAPGNSPGTLTINGNATYELDSYIDLELGVPSSDLIVVNGALTFEGTSLRLVAAAGFTLGTYTIFEYESIVGFEELSIDFTFGVASNLGFEATLINNEDDGTVEVEVTQLGGGSPSSVPEPTSVLLLALAGAGIAARRRR